MGKKSFLVEVFTICAGERSESESLTSIAPLRDDAPSRFGANRELMSDGAWEKSHF